MGELVEAAKRMPRGLDHPWSHVKYEIDDHTHIFWMVGCHGLGEIEFIAESLISLIEDCSPDRHGGHGRNHDVDPVAVFDEVKRQLENETFYEDYLALQRQKEHYAMWRGPVPRLVFLPDLARPGKWLVSVTHPETGLPTAYELPERLAPDLPPPDPRRYAAGKSFIIKRRERRS